MSKKIDSRLPADIGAATVQTYAGFRSPWEKLMSFYDGYAYSCRHHATMGALFQEVLRILLPDYEERVDIMCKTDIGMKNYVFNQMKIGENLYRDIHAEKHCLHPFFATTDNEGGFRAGAFGDLGDERMLMYGRVQDFSTYRVEKELDACPWDIMGSEICRVSTAAIEEISRAYGANGEFCMVEGRGCGDLHCRLIYENREKYPLENPRKAIWDNMDHLATADMIKYTPREKMTTTSQMFREECEFKYRNGMCAERTADEMVEDNALQYALGCDYCINPLNNLVKMGRFTMEQVLNVIECVFEGAGKHQFADFFAVKGLRDWLGVPADVNDGRVLGGYMEMIMQTVQCDYEIQAFNKDEVIYDINKMKLSNRMDLMLPAYKAMWYGNVKTLVSPEWHVWEEEGAPEGYMRLKIARKVDKFCR